MEVIGYGMFGDVYYIIVFVFDGFGGFWVMEMVFKCVKLSFLDIDYVNVYGILILVGDEIELGVVEWLFGDVVDGLVMLLIKFVIGYLFGVVGVVEVIFVILLFKN